MRQTKAFPTLTTTKETNYKIIVIKTASKIKHKIAGRTNRM